MARYRVLFVCIGNSCRSPMAEGFARHKHSDVIEAASAGVGPAPIVQPETIACMKAHGVDVSGIVPQSIHYFDLGGYDLVVNMSGRALGERLEEYPGGLLSWKVPDPIGQPESVYLAARDQIESLVDQLADGLRKAIQDQ